MEHQKAQSPDIPEVVSATRRGRQQARLDPSSQRTSACSPSFEGRIPSTPIAAREFPAQATWLSYLFR